MTTSRIDISHTRIRRLSDLSDLAEMLFPCNRNQQHAFLAIWNALRWAGNRMVPNLAEVAERQGVSKRTLERVRAKTQRMGLIDHVSRFNASHGYREGWILSSRFENSLRQLADKLETLKQKGLSRDKELLLLELADARRKAARNHDRSHGDDEVMKNENDEL